MEWNYQDHTIQRLMYEGKFGLERENLRVDARGALSHTKHPFGDDPHISRDFCENQIEIITEVADSAHGVMRELERLHRKAEGTLLSLSSGAEYIWPFSNPPRIHGESEIPVAIFEGDNRHKGAYRQYLARKYGKKKMLFSGIHFNFSFSDALIDSGYRASGCGTLQDYRDQLYLTLAKRLTQYSWLIVYLTAASSVTDDSFLNFETVGSRYASARCGEIGYWNDFVPVLSYDSLYGYASSIQRYIDEGKLMAISELYYPIRLKPKGENTIENLAGNGVDHIELRMIDVNPLSKVGIFEEDIAFFHLFILYLMSLKDEPFDAEQQTMAIGNMKRAAEYDDTHILIQADHGKAENIREKAHGILKAMDDFFSCVAAPERVFALIEEQRQKLEEPSRRYAVIVKERFAEKYTQKGLALAKEYAAYDRRTV